MVGQTWSNLVKLVLFGTDRYIDPHSNSKKFPNVPSEVKKEMRQLLVQRNKSKAKKATNIEEIRAKLQGIMGGSHRHLIDDDDEDKEDNVYMYPVDINLHERTDYQAECCASKASEWN